jgi:formate dehydrogenase
MKIVAVLYPGGRHADDERLLGCAEQALGLRPMLEEAGHELVALTDREGGDGLDEALADADVLITTPFWPVYVDRATFDRAPQLKLVVTAGVGSDHIDLRQAAGRGVTVAEVTGSNVVSVAEHAMMLVLVLLRNFVESQAQVVDGRWDIAELAVRSHDLEHKVVGIYGAGRIGQLIALRLRPFDVTTLYYKRSRLSAAEEATLGIRYAGLDELLDRCDVLVVGAPLTPETEGVLDADALARMKPSAHVVNIARGAIVDRDALVDALEGGRLAGYAGDVWDPEPAPADHPWRHMPHQAMTPHLSGTSLESQQRYAAGVRSLVGAFLGGDELPAEDVIVQDGDIVGGAYRAAYAS